MLDRIFKARLFKYIYTSLLFLLACAVTLINEGPDGAIMSGYVNATILFGYIAALTMILSSRLTDAMLPALLLCVFVTRCYDSAAAFTEKIPYFIPVVIAIIAHFIIYRKPLRIGRSFPGLCAVAVAVTLGGLGTISSSDYFAGGALYYVFGLGFGMIVFYLLVKSHFTEESGREVARIMYIIGLFACFTVLRFYFADIETVLETKQFVEFQSSNNLATFLMFAMPFPLFYASRRYIDVLSVILIYLCVVLTGSRGGLLMGTVEFVVIFFAFAIFDKRHFFNRIFYMTILLSFVILVIKYVPYIATFYNLSVGAEGEELAILDYLAKIKEYFIKDGEVRMQLIDRMKEDFEKNPVFGVGIGYTGNVDIYNPVKGAMNWYHMWFAQVVGGLGSVGILAYGYQLIERIVTFFKNRNLLSFTFFMSYFGLFLMSQVNPGEFCPMPYTALAVTFFIVMEKDGMTFGEIKDKIKSKFKKKETE